MIYGLRYERLLRIWSTARIRTSSALSNKIIKLCVISRCEQNKKRTKITQKQLIDAQCVLQTPFGVCSLHAYCSIIAV